MVLSLCLCIVVFAEMPNDDGNVLFFDHDYARDLFDMVYRVNPNETVVGWYHTGTRLRPTDPQLHRIVKRFCDDPVLLVIDVNPDVQVVPANVYVESRDAFAAGAKTWLHKTTLAEDNDQDAGQGAGSHVANNTINSGSSGVATSPTDVLRDADEDAFMFQHVALRIGACEAEAIGVEQLLCEIRGLDVSRGLNRVLSARSASLVELTKRLWEIHTYLTKVLAGKLPVNQSLLARVQQLFSSRMKARPDGLELALSECGVDAMMTMYVGNVLKSVLAMHHVLRSRRALRDGFVHEMEAKSKGTAASEADREEKATRRVSRTVTPGRTRNDDDHGAMRRSQLCRWTRQQRQQKKLKEKEKSTRQW